MVKVKTVHSWRLCPYGQHWVRTHEMRVPPSKTHPEGAITTRHEHCAQNPTGNTNPQNLAGQGRRGRVRDVYTRCTQVSDEEPNEARPNFQDWYKDQLYLDEIQEISKQHFSYLKNKPCSIDLGFKNKFVDGSQYDDLIAGWTQYWNEIFQPEIFLDPNTVKALIASESGFDLKLLAN